jgi:hypothetical protein
MQTREHYFKVRPAWKEQQKTLWEERGKERGKGNSGSKVRAN